MSSSTHTLPLLARRLKVIRNHAGLSQMELGVRAGIDESTASARINQYERGKHTPDFLTVCNLARVLCVDAAYFYAQDDTLANLNALYVRLSAEEQKMVMEFATLLATHTAAQSDISW